MVQASHENTVFSYGFGVFPNPYLDLAHAKTIGKQCFRGLPAPRSTTSPNCMRKRAGCREWCCFVYYFVCSFSMTLCSNVGPIFEKAQPSMFFACSRIHIWTWHTPKPWEHRVFSWLACTTLENQSHFYAKRDCLSRVVLFSILLCGLTFHAQIIKLQGPSLRLAISQHAPPLKHDLRLHGTSSVPSVKCSHMYTVYTCALPYR